MLLRRAEAAIRRVGARIDKVGANASMKINLALALLVFAAAGPAAPAPASMQGDWLVTSVAGASPVTAITGAVAARLVGTRLTISAHSLKFAGQTCQPGFKMTRETPSDFLSDYKTDAATLNLPDPIERLDGDCTEIFVLGPGELLFTWQGYFLRATKSAAPKK